jgi:hypothetical protein
MTQDADPYRMRRSAAGFAPMSAAIRWLYLVSVVCMLGGITLGVGVCVYAGVSGRADRHDDPTMGIGLLVAILSFLFIYGQVGFGCWWLYKAWAWLPFDQRWTRHWKSWITPGQAALMLLIPYFHYYWMFAINCGLCDALDRMRVSFTTKDPAPKGLAITCGVMQIVQFCFLVPLAGIFWFVFMTKIERMMREMSAASVPRMASAF